MLLCSDIMPESTGKGNINLYILTYSQIGYVNCKPRWNWKLMSSVKGCFQEMFNRL